MTSRVVIITKTKNQASRRTRYKSCPSYVRTYVRTKYDTYENRLYIEVEAHSCMGIIHPCIHARSTGPFSTSIFSSLHLSPIQVPDQASQSNKFKICAHFILTVSSGSHFMFITAIYEMFQSLARRLGEFASTCSDSTLLDALILYLLHHHLLSLLYHE